MWPLPVLAQSVPLLCFYITVISLTAILTVRPDYYYWTHLHARVILLQ